MTNDDYKSTSFLDLDISINNKLFDTKCYFKFQVVSLSLILGLIYLKNERMVSLKENYLEYANHLLIVEYL